MPISVKKIFKLWPMRVFLLLVVIITGWLWARSASLYKLGYCPTMAPYAEIVSLTGDFNLVALENSSQVLEQLRQGSIDLGLVGRKAYAEETVPGMKEFQGEEGYALIGSYSREINQENLSALAIHTWLSQDVMGRLLPHNNVRYYSSGTIDLPIDETVMISWSDYQGEPLVVPLEDNGLKDIRFRAPFFYYYQEQVGNILKEINF